MSNKTIKCDDCGGEMKSFSVYHWDDKYLGKLEVQTESNEYHWCAECDNERIAYTLMKRIEGVEQEKVEQLLLRSVNCDIKLFKANLVQNRDLVQLLGKSRQAIQQDGRIKTLIFHFVESNGQISYWLPSVELFAQKGDGRFDLTIFDTVSTTESVPAIDSALATYQDATRSAPKYEGPKTNGWKICLTGPSFQDDSAANPKHCFFKELQLLDLCKKTGKAHSKSMLYLGQIDGSDNHPYFIKPGLHTSLKEL